MQSPVRTDHRKYRFRFVACLRTGSESPPPSEKPYRRYHFFFFVTVKSRNRRACVVFRHRAPLPGRRTVPARFPVSKSPPPGRGGARHEGNRRPGGNDRAGRFILILFVYLICLVVI